MMPYLKNKYIFTFLVFMLYALFLDDVDIFSIVRQSRKLNQQEKAKVEIAKKLKETEETLKELRYLSGKEKFAREKKFFKRDNEDIFVITYE
ncbi:MAG: septum formation initiator family protein [Bacteroidetes bacterium]|nr:septum formation initiator family protein [Bacteroidota bacterium]